MKNNITAPQIRCLARDECWRDLDAKAIAAGKSSPTRKFACGFEAAGTVSKCKRLPRYAAPENKTEQLTMQLPCE